MKKTKPCLFSLGRIRFEASLRRRSYALFLYVPTPRLDGIGFVPRYPFFFFFLLTSSSKGKGRRTKSNKKQHETSSCPSKRWEREIQNQRERKEWEWERARQTENPLHVFHPYICIKRRGGVEGRTSSEKKKVGKILFHILLDVWMGCLDVVRKGSNPTHTYKPHPHKRNPLALLLVIRWRVSSLPGGGWMGWILFFFILRRSCGNEDKKK